MKIRLLQVREKEEIVSQMRALKVDEAGIKIMSDKAVFSVLKIEDIPGLLANVLKQEMLSLGGEVAVPRDVITGKLKRTDCLVFGTKSEYTKLLEKLRHQPWGLDKLAMELKTLLENAQRSTWRMKAGRFNLNLGEKTCVMGVLNVTPDSFSDAGLFFKPSQAIERALELEKDGADILDIGGESSRPGAKTVRVKEELKRVIPVIKILAKRLNIPISIDTRKSEVARQAIEAGASMVNDVSGLRYDPEMKKTVACLNVPVVIMHMKGTPRTMQKSAAYKSLISNIVDYLRCGIEMATESGICRENIIVDPGIGFGKTVEHNLFILKNLSEFKVLGRPILVGTSRKSFMGKILNVEVNARLCGTLSSSSVAIINGAQILRAHDVKEVKQAAKLVDSIIKSNV